MNSSKRPVPPSAPRHPSVRLAHGVRLIDDYAWLRADNWRDVLRNPDALPEDIASYLQAENAYADALLAPTSKLRAAMVREMRGRIKEDDSEPPVPYGPWSYYERYREGGENEIVCRRPRSGGDEAVLLDGDALASGLDYFEIHSAEPSPDHRFIAWSLDDNGSEFCKLKVRDLQTAADGETLLDVEDQVVWTTDSRSFYYVRLDAEHRPSRVYLHRIGEAQDRDQLIFEERNPAFFVSLDSTQSGVFGVIDVNDHDSSELYLLDLRKPEDRPRLIAPRERMVEYEIDHMGDSFLIRTNADGAQDFKIVTAPIDAPERTNWRDLIRARDGVTIVSHVAYKNYLVRLEREDGLPRIVVRANASGEEHAIAFSEEAYALSFRSGREFDTNIVRFVYSSMTTPQEIYDYDMSLRTRELVKRQEIPSGHDASNYITRRIFAVADDGQKVPVSILYKRELPIDGTAPLFLTGYGAYGSVSHASFRPQRLSLVDRGFIFAIAHVRGGSERGRAWYLDGKLEKKQNTFTDFIAAARHLANEGFTQEGRIVAEGGSAGGLLMGAVANMAPELFAGIVADVPFVDALNTMLDADLPLTPPEWLEWGNPIKDRSAFETIRAYSPYDNVRAQPYPPILVIAGLTDPRVTYWEPAKWVAKLRATMTDGGPILLKTNMQAGHQGASGRFRALEETAMQFAFACACVQKGLAE